MTLRTVGAGGLGQTARAETRTLIMLHRLLRRERTVLGVLLSGAVVLATYIAGASLPGAAPLLDDPQRLLTGPAWTCQVRDPAGTGVVATAEERFEADGRRSGRLRLQDEHDQRLLVDVRFSGRWQFEAPWLTGAISEYHYEHVDGAAFPAERLAAIEAEFSEPEVLRVMALSERQLVLGADRSLYQCHRGANAPTTST